ncbi:hypothetical protein SAMN05444395_10396 [Flavobacterium fryxellicola]|nr:hypothetical protein SAMN05444395_10396 [Flavobacterium fryxellicola]
MVLNVVEFSYKYIGLTRFYMTSLMNAALATSFSSVSDSVNAVRLRN